MFPLTDFFKLAMRKGNDLLLLKMQKNQGGGGGDGRRGSPTSFCREHAPKYTLNLKKSAFISEWCHSVCKPKNIGIRSLKWNVFCQILFKWTYEVKLVNWWGSLKNKFEFKDHSFTHIAVTRWQDWMSRGQKSWIFFNFPHWTYVHCWTMCRYL